MSDPEEQIPLVTKPASGKEPRTWRGHPLNAFGECSATDAAACCLAFNAPHVAYGFNVSRGLGLSWWKEALKLFALTCGAFCVVRLVLWILVATQCGKECPYAHKNKELGAPMTNIMPLGASGSSATSGYSLAFDPTAKAASVATQTDPAAGVSVDATYSEKPTSDKKKKSCKDKHKDKETSDEAATPLTDAERVAAGPYRVDDEDKDDEEHDKKHHEFGFRYEDHKAKKSSCKGKKADKELHDDDEDDHHGHWHHEHDVFEDDLFEKLAENPEKLKKCVFKIAPWASIAIAVGLAVFVYGTYFAALRRQMMRERFGIEGTFRRDWLLWAFCSPCVLTQETRTLMHNNVEEGLWHGPLSAPAPVAPMAL